MVKENILLVGFMGTGKSTVAAELAKSGDFMLVDLDAVIERMAGMSVQEIFRQCGETAFRDLESTALSELSGSSGLVVATGGGILGRPENRKLVHVIGRVVYLRTPFATIQARLKLSKVRPLVKDEPDWHALETLLMGRIPFYEMADMIIDTDNKMPAEIAWEILQRLREVQA